MARRRNTTGDSNRYYHWLDKAEDDMLAAELLQQEPRCYNPCAFHCQQAIEKALKAYLLLSSSSPLDGHNLTWLCRQAVRRDQEFNRWLDECATLNNYYIETRYPTDIPEEIGEKEIGRALAMAREMYLFICQQVDEEMDRREEQSRRDKEKHKAQSQN